MECCPGPTIANDTVSKIADTREAALTTATQTHEHCESGTVALGSGHEIEPVDCWNVAIFEESVARCEDRAYRLAVHLLRSQDAAQEVLQETFLSAWENTSRFKNRGQFSTWVYRATVQNALGRLRFAGAQDSPGGADLLLSWSTIPRFWKRAKQAPESDWSTLPARQLSTDALFHHIREAVSLLPVDHRVAFILCDLEEISVEDGAEILDLPVAIARENLHTARLAICRSIGLHFSRGNGRSRGHAS